MSSEPTEDERRAEVIDASIRALTPPEEPAFEPLRPQSIQNTLDSSTFDAGDLKLWRQLAKGGRR